MALRRSALHPVAAATGAAFQERHGWDLATVYSTVEEEYLALTTAAGVHDASYTGRLRAIRSEEHTSELQSRTNLVCRLLLEKKKKKN